MGKVRFCHRLGTVALAIALITGGNSPAKAFASSQSESQSAANGKTAPNEQLPDFQVTVTGKPATGQKLSAVVSGGIPNDVTLSYQWLRQGKEITGATKPSYKVVKADQTKLVSVRVTAEKSGYPNKVVKPHGKYVPNAQLAKLLYSASELHIGMTVNQALAAFGLKMSDGYRYPPPSDNFLAFDKFISNGYIRLEKNNTELHVDSGGILNGVRITVYFQENRASTIKIDGPYEVPRISPTVSNLGVTEKAALALRPGMTLDDFERVIGENATIWSPTWGQWWVSECPLTDSTWSTTGSQGSSKYRTRGDCVADHDLIIFSSRIAKQDLANTELMSEAFIHWLPKGAAENRSHWGNGTPKRIEQAICGEQYCWPGWRSKP